jgi:hypothetical protein
VDVAISNIDPAANSFTVAEITEVAFTGTFRFGSRVIPISRLEDIRDIRVYENDESLQEDCSEQPGTFCVSDTEEGRSIVYYFFQTVTDSVLVFRLEYTVIGSLRVYHGGPSYEQPYHRAIAARILTSSRN